MDKSIKELKAVLFILVFIFVALGLLLFECLNLIKEKEELQNQILSKDIKYQIMQEEELSEERFNELDIDGDGKITSLDYLLAKNGER